MTHVCQSLTSEFDEGFRAQLGQPSHPYVVLGPRLRIKMQRPRHGSENHGVLVLGDLGHVFEINPTPNFGICTGLVVTQRKLITRL